MSTQIFQTFHFLLVKKDDLNKIKALKLLRVAEQQKVGKQGRDDGIKRYTTPLYSHFSIGVRYVGWSCILGCFMLSSQPCFFAFYCSTILQLIMFL